MRIFSRKELKKLFKPAEKSNGEDNGQVTIIGGSDLFHGAPLFSLKVASRIVDMVFFTTPEKSVGKVAEKIKSKLQSFIWIPWEDTDFYIRKSDAVLIGPGFRRFGSERTQDKDRNYKSKEAQLSRFLTETFLKKFPNKRWVIDAGSLQVMERDWIPENSILTPNKKEFEILFNMSPTKENAKNMAEKYKCIIVLKGPETFVVSQNDIVRVKGGNPGMTKGGTGDVLAGLTVGLLAKNDSFLAACSASYIAKKAGDDLFERVGTNYNADDLAEIIPATLHRLIK